MAILSVTKGNCTYQAAFHPFWHVFIQTVDSLTLQYQVRIVFKNHLEKAFTNSLI